MSERKWTPGEWTLCNNGKCTCKHVYSHKADQHVATGRPIACVHGEWGDAPDMIYGEVRQEQIDANARLIAAAPELYEALEAMVAAWHTRYCDDGPDLDEIEQRARAALAKARGEA